MGGVFMVIMQNPDALEVAGPLKTKTELMHFEANWDSYFGILTQAIGVGGVLIFGFVVSWIFGREYSDGTAKDLLSLPTSRARIIQAKFAMYALWCLVLVVSNLCIGFVIGSILTIPQSAHLDVHLTTYFQTTALTIILGTPIAFFAIWGKGYLAPLGFVALTLVFSQIIAATGYGNYFPWAIPGLFSGASGEYKAGLNIVSYGILCATSMLGYILTIWYWKYVDQTK
jgi:ABC-type transport system involved in multi-copper enzyme maturation permease subunit